MQEIQCTNDVTTAFIHLIPVQRSAAARRSHASHLEAEESIQGDLLRVDSPATADWSGAGAAEAAAVGARPLQWKKLQQQLPDSCLIPGWWLLPAVQME